MQHPAEREGRTKRDERVRLRSESHVGCVDPEPDCPLRIEVEDCDRRRRERERREVTAERCGHQRVDPCSEQWPQRERQHVEDAEVVEEPEVNQREALRRGLRTLRRTVGERSREAPDHGRNRQRREDHPAGRHRHEDALRTILEERARTAAVKRHVREEAGDQKEEAHAKDMDHVEHDGERRALRAVLRRDHEKKRHRRVQHDAEQQRERACGIESMETFLCAHRGLLKQNPFSAMGERTRGRGTAGSRRARSQGGRGSSGSRSPRRPARVRQCRAAC